MSGQCEVCLQFEQQLQAAYDQLADKKLESRKSGEESQRKLSRLLSAKHAHQLREHSGE